MISISLERGFITKTTAGDADAAGNSIPRIASTDFALRGQRSLTMYAEIFDVLHVRVRATSENDYEFLSSLPLSAPDYEPTCIPTKYSTCFLSVELSSRYHFLNHCLGFNKNETF